MQNVSPRDTPQDLGPAVPTATFGWQKKDTPGQTLYQRLMYFMYSCITLHSCNQVWSALAPLSWSWPIQNKSVTSNCSAQSVMARAAVQLVKVQVNWCLPGTAVLLKQISSKISWWFHFIISSWSSNAYVHSLFIHLKFLHFKKWNDVFWARSSTVSTVSTSPNVLSCWNPTWFSNMQHCSCPWKSSSLRLRIRRKTRKRISWKAETWIWEDQVISLVKLLSNRSL